MSTNTRFEYLFKKYLQQTCSRDEYLELMTLVNQKGNEQQLLQLTDPVWDSPEQGELLNPQRARAIFEQVISHPVENNTQPATKKRTWLQWAAAAVLLIGFTLTAVFYGTREPVVITPLVYARSAAEHRLVKLPDGSNVVLNKSSYLSYPVAFTAKTREVNLVGEGYFDIRHNAAHPFIVHTGKLVTTVLGTAFNIKAYNNDKNITVTVTRGKVSVSDEHHVLGVITPNEQLAFDKKEKHTVQLVVNAGKVVEWQSKDLFMANVTMQQATAELEQRFNVKITFANEAVKNCRFTGTFLHGEKLTDILQVICDFNNATYQTGADGHVSINGAGCP